MKVKYCPKCGKLELIETTDFNYRYFTNMRDGYGRPIRHYKCECGNYLAGIMDITGLSDNETDNIKYAKDIITAYNIGGDYYEDGLIEKAIEVLNERNKERG